MSAKISIIIPVYRAERTIAKCIESVLQNSYPDYEIIIISDGAIDNSWEILEQYREKYPNKIRIFKQENQGVAKTRNTGIDYATGKYVMFIDGDDWIEEDYLQKFVAEIETKDLNMVIGSYRRVTYKKTLYEMRLQPTEWSRYITMASWAKIYRREFLLENSIEFLDNNIGEDVYFNLQAINLTDKISIIDYCGYNWFYNEQSVSNTTQKTMKNPRNVMHLLDSCYDKLKEIGAINKKEVEFYFTRYIVWYLLFAGRKSDYTQTYAEFTKTFKWLQDKFPRFLENKNISLIHPRGETLRNRLAVFTFMLVYKLKLTKVFFKVYSK